MDLVAESASIALKKVVALKPNETVLIITNPRKDLLKISKALADVAKEVGAKPLKLDKIVPKNKIKYSGFIVVQPKKTSKDFMEPYVLKALKKIPNVLISVPISKIGKDKEGIKKEYRGKKKKYNNFFSYLMFEGKSKGFWMPGITLPMWRRAIDIDYNELEKEIGKLMKVINKADRAHITTKKGTNLWIRLKGRKAFADGMRDKRTGGGNMPCGEVFISPVVGSTKGILIIDGTIPLRTGETINCSLQPIKIIFKDGYISSVSKNKTGKKLLASIKWAEKEPYKLFKDKKKADKYAKNARHLGELGIGLNPKAILSGKVLEDEKVKETCHFAIGANYDEDAKALIHLDGIVKKPTIELHIKGKKKIILKNGKLKI
ncbi:leucyl aminopeptidase [Candidatus Woesearchaeota archaeon]|nr:leucyl aminopeptidase [Candidatus Woesearchaeota archaeon]